MSDRDDYTELINSARSVTKSSAFYFVGRIRYGTKNEKIEEKFLCMDSVRVFICSLRIPVKIEAQFNILSIKSIERSNDSHIIIETDPKQFHTLYGQNEKISLTPFLIILIRTIRTVFPHRLEAIVDIRPENEYDRLLRLSNEYFEDKRNNTDVCGGFSVRYECACDFYQTQCYRSIQNIVDTVFAHRTSREFTFREFESFPQRDWLPIIGALRHNDWFTKLTVENIKLSPETLEEICVATRLNKSIKDLNLINCGLKQESCTRLAQYIPLANIENLDLSNNPLEDKGLQFISKSLQQRKLPLRSINVQSCSVTHRSLATFTNELVNNYNLLKSLKILNLSGNRIKEENTITKLFSEDESTLEELYLSDIEFNLESFFHAISTLPCKLRRLSISSVKSNIPSSISGGVKLFFTKTQSLEVLQLSNANLSVDFLRELCDGLHSNVHLKKLDLCLSGNPLEPFIREYAQRFAAIPSLTALDLSGCDLDNEIASLLIELKKNRNLKSLNLSKNLNNIKPKNVQKTINALKDLVVDSRLEYLSIADAKLRDNMADFLLTLSQNTSLKTLDIRGNSMGDTGALAFTHLLQVNRCLQTAYFDRNLLSLTNLEDIVNAMKQNSTIQYLPIPITDIILMKTSEKERMEKLQFLINQLDSLCLRNQQKKELSSTDSLLVTTQANLARELNASWESQQQLFGDQISLEYVQSCVNRAGNKNNEIKQILTRSERIAEVSSRLHEIYSNEEERLRQEWNDVCKLFQDKLVKSHENLSKQFYQLFREQSLTNPDDRLQEEIRMHFTNTNSQVHQLLNKQMPVDITNYTRECFTNVATCLQKRAYDTIDDLATNMHQQLESTIMRTPMPPSLYEGQYTPSSTLERIVNRITHKHTNPQSDPNDESALNRQVGSADSYEYLSTSSPNRSRSTSKDNRLLSPNLNKGRTPTSQKSPLADRRQTAQINSNEHDYVPTNAKAQYNNYPVLHSTNKQDIATNDDGDTIENDLLDIVNSELQKDRLRNTSNSNAEDSMPSIGQNDSLDIQSETAPKLVHLGRDRPRRGNVRPPAKRSTEGVSLDNSSDGGLDTDDHSVGETQTIAPRETQNKTSSDVSKKEVSPPPNSSELPPKTITKIQKVLQPLKSLHDEAGPPPVPVKSSQTLIALQSRTTGMHHYASAPASTTTASSVSMNTNDSSVSSGTDSTHDSVQITPPMSSSSNTKSSSLNRDGYGAMPSDNSSSHGVPPIVPRSGKVTGGTRVLPAMDSNGEIPQVRLRQVNPERKVAPSVIENPSEPVVTFRSRDALTATGNEPSKHLSVRERAIMLTAQTSQASVQDRKALGPKPPSNASGYLNEK